jgi:hypothetical protein
MKPQPRNNIGHLQQELNMYLVSGNDDGVERVQRLIDEELAKILEVKEDADE